MKIVKDLYLRAEIMKLLEENHHKLFQDIDLGQFVCVCVYNLKITDNKTKNR